MARYKAAVTIYLDLAAGNDAQAERIARDKLERALTKARVSDGEAQLQDIRVWRCGHP